MVCDGNNASQSLTCHRSDNPSRPHKSSKSHKCRLYSVTVRIPKLGTFHSHDVWSYGTQKHQIFKLFQLVVEHKQCPESLVGSSVKCEVLKVVRKPRSTTSTGSYQGHNRRHGYVYGKKWKCVVCMPTNHSNLVHTNNHGYEQRVLTFNKDGKIICDERCQVSGDDEI